MLEGYIKDNFKIYMVSRLQQSLMQRKPNSDVKSTKSMAHEIKGKGMSRRVCHEQLLCKVSNSQLSLMQRKPNFDVKTKLRLKKITKSTDCDYRARAPGQGACLKGISKTMTMQGFILAVITDVGKTKLRNFDVNVDGRKFGLLYRTLL